MEFTEENKKALLEYERLKILIKVNTEAINELKKVITPLIGEDQQVQASKGYFEKRSRISWNYSYAVSDLQNEEKAKGVAQKKEITSLYYVQDK